MFENYFWILNNSDIYDIDLNIVNNLDDLERLLPINNGYSDLCPQLITSLVD